MRQEFKAFVDFYGLNNQIFLPKIVKNINKWCMEDFIFLKLSKYIWSASVQVKVSLWENPPHRSPFKVQNDSVFSVFYTLGENSWTNHFTSWINIQFTCFCLFAWEQTRGKSEVVFILFIVSVNLERLESWNRLQGDVLGNKHSFHPVILLFPPLLQLHFSVSTRTLVSFLQQRCLCLNWVHWDELHLCWLRVPVPPLKH